MKPVNNSKMKRCDHTLNLTMNTLFLAVVACSVFVTEGSVFIEECANMELQLSGVNTEITFTCGGLLVNGTAQWVLTHTSDLPLSLKCPSNGMTCDKTSANIALYMLNESTSVLTVFNNYTSWSQLSTVTCSQLDYNMNNFFRCNISWNRAPTSGLTPVPTIQPTQPPQTEVPSVTTSSTKTSTQGPSSIPSTTDEQHNHVSGPSSISSTTDEQRNQDNNDDLPVEAIAGGVAAAVAVIIIIVIIIMIIVIKRRKRQKPAGNGHANNDDRVNPLYGEGDPAQSSPANGQPAGVALMLPAHKNYSSPAPSKPKPAAATQRSDDGLDAGYASVASPSAGQSSGRPSPQTSAATLDKAPNCVTDQDMYIAMDGPGLRKRAENAEEEKADAGYSTVGISSAPPSASAIPSKTAPSGDVYAVVQKSGPMAKSSASNGPADTAAEGADNTYAVVDKSRSNAPASSASNASPNDLSPNNADNTYAVVDKSRSTAPTSSTAGNAPSRGYTANSAYVFVGKSSPSENNAASFTTADTTGQASSGDVYAQVNKSAKQGRQASNRDGGEESSQSAPVYAVVNKQKSKGENTTTIQAQNGKPKPPTKPKPAVKPKPGTNGFE